MIDFHCHLDLYPEPARVINECRKQDLFVLSITTTPSAWSITNAFVKTESQLQTAIGLHPQLAHERKSEINLFDKLLEKSKFVGEIGLDGSREFQLYWKDQIMVFEHILSSCQRAGGRIMSIHSRQASQKVLDCLEVYPMAGIPILHWFSGSFADLDRAIYQGCWFSVGPAMLSSSKGRALSKRMPHDRILTESDGPFSRFQKRSLLPWDVNIAVNEFTVLWGTTMQEVQETFNDNLYRLLNLI